MPQNTVLRARGLYTFVNDLSEDPQGALSEALNVVIDRNSIIEPRRGIAQFGSPFSATSSDVVNQVFSYKDRILINYSNKLAFDSTGNGNFTDFIGNYSSASNFRMKGIEANGNFFLATDSGVQKISTSSAANLSSTSILPAGGVKALNLNNPTLVGTTGFLDGGKQVAYRMVWGYRDSNNNLILGSPSSRIVVNNTNAPGNFRNVELTFAIPEEIINSPISSKFFYQIYRTALFDSSPDEEYFLVFEDFPTFPATSVTITESQPDTLRAGGALLYTNAVSGEGIINANEKPPFAKDIDVYKNYTFYANTKTVHRLTVTLLTGDSSLDGGTITVDDGVNTPVVYEFVAPAGSPAPGNVAVERSASIGSPALEIEETALNLVTAINTTVAEDTVYAYYLSGADDLPGQILLEHRQSAGSQFTVTTTGLSSPAKFDPDLSAGVSSDSEIKPNRIYYSKFQQPEAVPLGNFIDVGAQDEEIQRIVALREGLFIFKEDGIFRLTGNVAPFQVSSFDRSAVLFSPDSAVVLNNQIYAFSTQGVITVTDTGVQVISRPIEDVLLSITRNSFDQGATSFRRTSFGVSYETDRAYLLFLPTNSTDVTATQCFRYNSFTRSWTRWEMDKTCGIINDDRLYLGPADINFVERERKNRDRTDYADRSIEKEIIANGVNKEIIELNNIANVVAGDVVLQTQFLTINQFNRLLIKLDDDPTVVDSDYSLLSLNPGDNIISVFSNLTAKLDLDAGLVDTDYAALHGSPVSVQDAQTQFNDILVKLDSDAGAFFTNYNTIESDGTTLQESTIIFVDNNEQVVQLDRTVPYLEGTVEVLKSFQTRITWSPDILGDVSIMKQVREGTIIFEDNNFTTATLAYATDLSPGFESITFSGKGAGNWGRFSWGGTNWGGLSAAIPMRTLIPRQKQRCRFIQPRFEHKVAYEKFAIYGYSLTFRAYSEKAYR